MRRILTSLTLLVVSLPTIVAAQTHCANRDQVIQRLETGYGEEFAGGGVQNAKRIFEVWFSEEKGTWTILMTKADGTTCIMASGTNWREGLTAMKKPAGIPS